MARFPFGGGLPSDDSIAKRACPRAFLAACRPALPGAWQKKAERSEKSGLAIHRPPHSLSEKGVFRSESGDVAAQHSFRVIRQLGLTVRDGTQTTSPFKAAYQPSGGKAAGRDGSHAHCLSDRGFFSR